MITEVRDRLSAELERLSRQLSREDRSVPAGEREPGAEETSNGDRSELRQRIRQLEQLAIALSNAEAGSLAVDRVGLGSRVTLVDLDSGIEVAHILSAGADIDVDAGEVSLDSPIGHALLDRQPGDEIEAMTPRGRRRFRLVDLTTLPRMLGLTEEQPGALV
jgi:transcription elongation factor GreA